MFYRVNIRITKVLSFFSFNLDFSTYLIELLLLSCLDSFNLLLEFLYYLLIECFHIFALILLSFSEDDVVTPPENPPISNPVDNESTASTQAETESKSESNTIPSSKPIKTESKSSSSTNTDSFDDQKVKVVDKVPVLGDSSVKTSGSMELPSFDPLSLGSDNIYSENLHRNSSSFSI